MNKFVREENILYIYFQILKTYKSYLASKLKGYNMSSVELDILSFLANNMDKEITASDISSTRGVSKGIVSKGVHSLIEKDLIYLEENKEDRRSAFIFLKNKNNPLLNEVIQVNKTFFEVISKDVSREELIKMNELNLKILKSLKKLDEEEK